MTNRCRCSRDWQCQSCLLRRSQQLWACWVLSSCHTTSSCTAHWSRAAKCVLVIVVTCFLAGTPALLHCVFFLLFWFVQHMPSCLQLAVDTPAAKRRAITYFGIESAVALFFTLVINVCVMSVFARGFFGQEIDIGLENAGEFLARRFGTRSCPFMCVSNSIAIYCRQALSWASSGLLDCLQPVKRAR